MRCFYIFACFMAGLLMGCGMTAKPMPDKTDVSGRLLVNGKPLGGVKVVLQPLGEGSDAHAVTDAAGGFKTVAVPGTYTWYVSPKDEKRASEALLKGLSEQFRSGSMERVVKTGHGLELTVK